MKTNSFPNPMQNVHLPRGLTFGLIITGALLAFEIFNFSTTDFAMNDLLGDISFWGIRWSTILAIAFCGIDFAGIARIFTPETGADEPMEVWYLFGAWLLAATMNAVLTWWGISIAILNNTSLGSAVIDQATMLKIVPIFVAILVWLSRLLLIGTFTVAGERLYSDASQKPGYTKRRSHSRASRAVPQRGPAASVFRPAPKSAAPSRQDSPYAAPDPSYHPVSMSGRSESNSQSRY